MHPIVQKYCLDKAGSYDSFEQNDEDITEKPIITTDSSLDVVTEIETETETFMTIISEETTTTTNIEETTFAEETANSESEETTTSNNISDHDEEDADEANVEEDCNRKKQSRNIDHNQTPISGLSQNVIKNYDNYKNKILSDYEAHTTKTPMSGVLKPIKPSILKLPSFTTTSASNTSPATTTDSLGMGP